MANKRGIARDVLGELLETGKQTVKAGGRAAGDIAGQTAKTIISGGKRQSGDKDLSDLKRMEKGQGGQRKPRIKKQQSDMSEMSVKEQIKKMADLDKQAYEEVQRQIQLLRKQKESQPRKYEAAKPEFDKEQVDDPESFWDKMKKKRKKTEKDKKDMPLSVQKGKTSTEIRRGSG